MLNAKKKEAFCSKQYFRLTNPTTSCLRHRRCLQVNRASLVSVQKGESCVWVSSFPVCLLRSLSVEEICFHTFMSLFVSTAVDSMWTVLWLPKQCELRQLCQLQTWSQQLQDPETHMLLSQMSISYTQGELSWPRANHVTMFYRAFLSLGYFRLHLCFVFLMLPIRILEMTPPSCQRVTMTLHKRLLTAQVSL